MLEEEGLAQAVCKQLRLENSEPHNEEWEQMAVGLDFSSFEPVMYGRSVT